MEEELLNHVIDTNVRLNRFVVFGDRQIRFRQSHHFSPGIQISVDGDCSFTVKLNGATIDGVVIFFLAA